MKLRAFLIPALAVCLGASSALADELIRFKSGYEMMVVSHREEGRMIIVSLDGGGEVGFKKELIESIEGNRPTSRTGPSPLWNKVHSRVTAQKFIAPQKEQQPSRYLARGVGSPEGVSVGYSKAGEKAHRFAGGPTGPVSAYGKIGIDFRERSRANDPTLSDRDRAHAKKKAKTRTMEASLPGAEEGD